MRNCLFIGWFVLLASCGNQVEEQENMKLWYTRPAENWNEALPVGNGRIGAMIFGTPGKEVLQLNEETVWAGGPNNNINPEARRIIPELRRLIFEGKYESAQELADRKMVAPNDGMPYQPVGSLIINFPGHEAYTGYYRELNISNALATIHYNTGNIAYKREIFSSFTDQVIIVRLTADKAGSITCDFSMKSPQKHNIVIKDQKMILQGISGDHDNQTGKVKFETQVMVKPEGGNIITSDTIISIIQANSATVYISTGTNFNHYNDLSGDATAKAGNYLDKALQVPFNKARDNHIRYYKNYFDRVNIDLGLTDSVLKPTDVRIAEFSEADDPQLVALYFQFGRYLLISSSQPGTQPPNLQGLWNKLMKPPWESKYTLNINTEMNYWPVEITNLSELHEPLFRMIKDLSVTGQESAEKMYAAGGWVIHHNTDIWRFSGNIDRAYYGLWPCGGIWLCQHLWEHYLFTGDNNYLMSAYPVMRGAAKYLVDALQEEPENNWLVICPSNSPENDYLPGITITAGATMDNQLVFDLFRKTISAAEILQTDQAFRDTLKSLIPRLAPMQIGRYGQLQEWMHDWDDPEDKHRHVSHLYGLYPGNQISPYHTPRLFDAARTSLIFRGDVSTGWSMGWKVNLWARMLDGDHALKLIKDQISPAILPNGDERGGTYPNLFDAHPPFQIDGNFGCAAGIAEMLVQSHDGAIHILPALPDSWKEGKVEGLRTRGGFEVDIAWKENKVTGLTVKSTLGGNCRLKLHSQVKSKDKNLLKKAEGPNPNRYFNVPDIAEPLISPKAQLKEVSLKDFHMYDFITDKGMSYYFSGIKQK